MNDPRVIALHYRIEHDRSVDYSEAEPAEHDDEEEFRIQIEDGRVHFEMKKHHATERSAQGVVEPYIESWELDAALTGQPGQFKLKYEGAHIGSTPGKHVGSPGPVYWEFSTLVSTVTISKPYPKPPDGVSLKRNCDVRVMLSRYEDFYDGKKRLTDLAQFCLTMLEKVAGGRKSEDRWTETRGRRTKAVERFGIKGCVLNEVGYLSSEKGGPTDGRKADAAEENDLTPDERRFLLCNVKKFIRKVAKEAQSSGSNTRNGHL